MIDWILGIHLSPTQKWKTSAPYFGQIEWVGYNLQTPFDMEVGTLPLVLVGGGRFGSI